MRIVDSHNYEQRLYRRMFNSEPLGKAKLDRLVDWLEVAAFERRWVRFADAATACSPVDAEALRRVARRDVALVPNGVDTGAIHFAQRGGQTAVVMVGMMSWTPNVEAAVDLVGEVMPGVWRVRPDVHVYIVGKQPHPSLAALAGDRVTVTGAVESVRPYLDRAALTVVALRTGGGTRLKILEAMAAGVPVVSSALGAEGLDLVDGADAHIYRTGDHAAAVAAILAILDDPEHGRTLARGARTRVERDFDWSVIGHRLRTVVEAAAGAATPRPG
jgi:glycosyltransferase involved in cell wall biosynthesis